MTSKIVPKGTISVQKWSPNGVPFLVIPSPFAPKVALWSPKGPPRAPQEPPRHHFGAPGPPIGRPRHHFGAPGSPKGSQNSRKYTPKVPCWIFLGDLGALLCPSLLFFHFALAKGDPRGHYHRAPRARAKEVKDVQGSAFRLCWECEMRRKGEFSKAGLQGGGLNHMTHII